MQTRELERRGVLFQDPRLVLQSIATKYPLFNKLPSPLPEFLKFFETPAEGWEI